MSCKFLFRSAFTSGTRRYASTSAANTDTTHYRITLRRSAIGLPSHTKKVLESLGLRKRLQSIYRPKRADIAGMLLAVKELIHVENVKRLDGGLEAAAMRMAEQVRSASTEADADVIDPLPVRDEDALWVNDAGEVVDWGGKQARKAPRGFKVVGNVVSDARHREIIERQT